MCLWDYDRTSTVSSHWQIQHDKNDYMLNCLVTPLNTHTHTLSHTHTHAHTHAHAHTHTHAHSHACTHTYAHTHTRTHTHTHTHAHVHARTLTHAHTHTLAHARRHTRAHMHARTHTHTHSRQETEQTHSSPSSIKLKERIRILVKSFNLLSQNSNLYWNSKSDDDDFFKRFQNKKQDFSEWHILKCVFFFPPLKDNPNQTYPTINTQSLMKEVYVN